MTTKIPPELVDDQVFGRKNLIINGDMRLNERGTVSTGGSSVYTLDRYLFDYNGGTNTCVKSDLSSSDTPYTHGFRNAIKLTNTSVGTDAAANFVRFQQRIEAQNLANSGWNYTSDTSFVTLSFWVKSSLAGTYAIALYNEDSASKNYSFEFTLSANTWTKVTHAIKGDSSLVVNNDSGEGLRVQFFVHAGTNYSTSSHTNEAWQTYSGSDQVKDYGQSWSATASATFEVTGLQLEVGSQATPFEHRSFHEELFLSQRYYQSTFHGGPATPIGGYSYGNWKTCVPMRAAPTESLLGSNTINRYNSSGLTGTIPVNQIQNSTSAGVNNLSIRVYSQTSTDNYMEGRIQLDAELS